MDPNNTTLSVRIPYDLRIRVDRLALRRKVSLGFIVREALEQILRGRNDDR